MIVILLLQVLEFACKILVFNLKLRKIVRIINYQRKETEEGKEFFVLQLQGGIEMVKSTVTGKFYITARKATIPATFDEQTCQSLIGTQIPGEIQKVSCEPYDYTIKDTGETVTLNYKFEYVEENAIYNSSKSETTIDEFMSNSPKGTSFSTNGHLVDHE